MVRKTLDRWKRQVNYAEVETYSLYLAYKDPRVPLYVKLLVFCIVAYPFSPIDKLLDPIPFIGYADHLILFPLGVTLLLRKMIPRAVLSDCRKKAEILIAQKVSNHWVANFVILGIWFLFASLGVLFTARILKDWNLVLGWWLEWFKQALT